MRARSICGVAAFSGILAAFALAEQGDSQVPAYAPGTRDFYEANIRDKYVLNGDTLVPVRQHYPPDIPGVLRPPTTGLLDGSVTQILDGSNIVVTARRDRPSGAPRTIANIVHVPDSGAMSVGDEVRLCTSRDGDYACTTHAGVRLTVAGHRLVPTITFEEYLRVYTAESADSNSHKIAAFERAPQTAPSAAQVRQAQVRQLYQQRLKARREALSARTGVQQQKPSDEDVKAQIREHNMNIIRAGGARGPALPITLTKEEDAQLVKEGVLPPINDRVAAPTPANKAIDGDKE